MISCCCVDLALDSPGALRWSAGDADGPSTWDGHREDDLASPKPIGGSQKKKTGWQPWLPTGLTFIPPTVCGKNAEPLRDWRKSDVLLHLSFTISATQFFGPSAGMDDRRPFVGISTHIPIIGCPRLVAIENRSDADGMFAKSDNLIHHSFTNFSNEKRSVWWTICWWRFRSNAAIKMAKERMWD